MEYVTTTNSLDNSSFASDDVTDATTDLDYEMDDPLEFSDIAHLVLMYGTTFLLGVVGNILVIFTVAQQRPKNKHTVTNIFLTSLASADLLLILICVPLKVSSRSRPTLITRKSKFVKHMYRIHRAEGKIIAYL